MVYNYESSECACEAHKFALASLFISPRWSMWGGFNVFSDENCYFSYVHISNDFIQRLSFNVKALQNGEVSVQSIFLRPQRKLFVIVFVKVINIVRFEKEINNFKIVQIEARRDAEPNEQAQKEK